MPGPPGPTAPPEPPAPPVPPEPPLALGAMVPDPPAPPGPTLLLDAPGAGGLPVLVTGTAVEEVGLSEVLVGALVGVVDGPPPDCDWQAADSTDSAATALTATTADHVRTVPPVPGP